MDEVKLRERLHDEVDNMSMFNVIVLMILVQAVRAIDMVRSVQNRLPSRKKELPEPEVESYSLEGIWATTDPEDIPQMDPAEWSKTIDDLSAALIKTQGRMQIAEQNARMLVGTWEDVGRPYGADMSKVSWQEITLGEEGPFVSGYCTPSRGSLMTAGLAQISCGVPDCNICSGEQRLDR